MENNKSLKMSVILSYLTEAVCIIMSLAFTPIKIKLLPVSEYGIYQTVASIIGYLSLLSMGFGSSYIRFYARRKVKGDDEGIARLNGMFLTIFSVIAVAALVLGTVMIFNVNLILGEKITSGEAMLAQRLMFFLLLSIAMTFPASVFSNYLIANERFVFLKLLAIAQNVLNPVLTFPLLLIGYRSTALVVVATALNFIQLLLYIWYSVKRLKMKFSFAYFDWGLLKEIWTFSFYIFINLIVDQVNWSVDRLILTREVGAERAAVYSLGAQMNSLYITFSTSISTVFIPRLNKLVVGGGQKDEVSDLFIRIGRIQYFILTYILMGFIILGRFFIHIMSGGKAGYENAYLVALLLMVPMVIPLIQNIGIEIQKAKNMHRFRAALYSLIAVGNVALTLLLVNRYQELGAALATGIALLIGNGLLMNWYYHQRVELDIKRFWVNILKILPFTLLAGLLGNLIGNWIGVDNVLQFVIVGVLYSAIYFVIMWLGGLNRYEKELVLKPLNKILMRLKGQK